MDVVAQLNSTFYSNLSDDQKRTFGITPDSYGWSEFRVNVLHALRSYYGQTQIAEGNKTLKLKAGNGHLPADVVVCSQFRRYKTVNNGDYVEGMCFWTKNEDRRVINYPKVHYENGVSKHDNTNKWYKPVVRIFKNTRNTFSSDNTPSYFLECLIYNTPHSKFGTCYQDSFCNVINWLNQADLDRFMCKNGQHKLFGTSPEQWNTVQAQTFIKNVISLWNNW